MENATPAWRRRKVSILTVGLVGGTGGAQRGAAEIAAALLDRGFNVEMASNYEPGSEVRFDVAGNVPVANLRDYLTVPVRNRLAARLAEPIAPKIMRGWLRSHRDQILAIRSYVEREKPRLVVAFTSDLIVDTAAALETIKPRPRFAGALRNSIDRDFALRSTADNTKNRWLLGPSLTSCTAIQVLFPSYRRQMDGIGTYGSRLAAKTIWIPNYIEPNPKGVASPDSTKIIAIGRLEKIKDHQSLIHAFAKVRGIHPDWSLDIFGEGNLMEELRALISRLGLDGAVRLAGYDRDIALRLTEAAIHVQPSVDEGFSRALAEGMGTGLPSIVFNNCPGSNELIVDGENGLLVDPSDRVGNLAEAMLKLIGDKKLRARMGAAALAQAESGVYSRGNVYDRWARLVDSLMRPGRFDPATLDD